MSRDLRILGHFIMLRAAPFFVVTFLELAFIVCWIFYCLFRLFFLSLYADR
jgi:hypothetical protein